MKEQSCVYTVNIIIYRILTEFLVAQGLSEACLRGEQQYIFSVSLFLGHEWVEGHTSMYDHMIDKLSHRSCLGLATPICIRP